MTNIKQPIATTNRLCVDRLEGAHDNRNNEVHRCNVVITYADGCINSLLPTNDCDLIDNKTANSLSDAQSHMLSFMLYTKIDKWHSIRSSPLFVDSIHFKKWDSICDFFPRQPIVVNK
jgi:hypothetical protein